MNRSSLRRTGAAGAALVALSIGLAACGSSDSSDSSAGDTTSATTSSAASAPATSESAAAATDAGAQTFGPACDAIPKDGKGSFNGMVTDPVATAASNNPLLSTLVTAVGAVPGLADTLNAAPALTVFAPTNDAFAKIPADQLKSVLADQATLTAILSHHVVGEQLGPDQLAGDHQTLNGDTISIAGDADSGFTVDGKAASIICGNIPTKNATVYVIDSVLMPTK
jgi:uncharacterized surface protein with fasciclin (FAS1) repeats